MIDELIEHLRDQHVQRMTGGERNIPVGIEYQDILLHLERISDQCSDIAVYLLGRNDTAISGHEHQYIHDLHHTESAAYANEFETARKKYFEAL